MEDDEIDWRLKVTTTVTKNTVLHWNDQEIKKGDRIKVVSIVDLPEKRTLILPVPSLTALYISNSEKSWKKYWAIRKERKIDSSLKKSITFKDDKESFDALELIATSIISAFTAIEAFCNDSIPEDHEYWHNKKSDLILEKSDKKEIERFVSIEKKLNIILPKIFGVDPPKGRSPVWVSYKKLKECRDSLIHAKSHETRSVDSGKTNLWDKLFKIQSPHLLAKDVFDWYLKGKEKLPQWYIRFPK